MLRQSKMEREIHLRIICTYCYSSAALVFRGSDRSCCLLVVKMWSSNRRSLPGYLPLPSSVCHRWACSCSRVEPSVFFNVLLIWCYVGTKRTTAGVCSSLNQSSPSRKCCGLHLRSACSWKTVYHERDKQCYPVSVQAEINPLLHRFWVLRMGNTCRGSFVSCIMVWYKAWSLWLFHY